MRLLVVAALSALCISAPASGARAQGLPSEAEAKEITVEGRLVACSLEFRMAFADQVYKEGAIAAVTGSINLWNTEKNKLHSSFKLVGADIAGARASSGYAWRAQRDAAWRESLSSKNSDFAR